jgi:hypothetical protein
MLMPTMLSANILILFLQVSQAYFVWKTICHAQIYRNSSFLPAKEQVSTEYVCYFF